MSDDMRGSDHAELRNHLEVLADEGPTAGHDAVLSSAGEQVARRRRNQRVAISAGAAATLVALVLISISISVMGGDGGSERIAVSPPTSDAPDDAITFTLELDTTEVVAGEELTGNVVVENTTGRTVGLTGGMCGSKWAVAWGSDDWDPGEGLAWTTECGPPLEVPPGRSIWPFSVAASYTMCDRVPGGTIDERVPACTANGSPPLPAGTYEVALVLTGETASDGTSEVPVLLPDPIEVTVTADD